jgi:hypothetical protein
MVPHGRGPCFNAERFESRQGRHEKGEALLFHSWHLWTLPAVLKFEK